MRNPLESYRRVQRALRREFNDFTARHCASCPTPCCVKPARIAPSDILLAEGIGWQARVQAVAERDAVQQTAGQLAQALTDSDAPPPTPCDYLGEKGCTFPSDLRPFGCTTYICRYMYEYLDRKTLARLRRMTRELEQHHEALMAALHHRHGRAIVDPDDAKEGGPEKESR